MVRTRTFKSGNSVALRLPRSLGIKEGTEMQVREERGRYIVEPVASEPRKIDLSGIYGTGAGLRPLKDEERELEMRDLDWEGRLLRDG